MLKTDSGVSQDGASSSRFKLPGIDVGSEPPLQVGDIPQESALRVAKGSIGFASVAFVAGAINGALRAQPAVLYGLNSGFSTFAFAFPILALREYAVAPSINVYVRNNFPDHQPSLHTHNLIASTVSGALAGGAMSAYFRGRQKFLAGARTWAVLAFGLQLVGNELRVLRVNLLSSGGTKVLDRTSGKSLETEDGSMERLRKAWKEPIKPERTHDLAGIASSAAASSVGGVEGSSGVTSSDSTLRKPRSSATPNTNENAEPKRETWASRAWTTLASYSPVKRIDDAEYEQRLTQERQAVVDRIRQIDQHIAQEEATSRKV